MALVVRDSGSCKRRSFCKCRGTRNSGRGWKAVIAVLREILMPAVCVCVQEWGRSGAAKEGPIVAKEEAIDAPASAPSRSASSVSSPHDVGREGEVAHSGSAATPSESQDSSFEEEEAVSAPASPGDTSLAVFPLEHTPTDLGGGVCVGAMSTGLAGAGGMGAGGIMGGIYAFGGDGSEGLEGGAGRLSASQWSRPQSPSEFFCWSSGEYCT